MAIDRKKKFFKKKACRFCANNDIKPDYKNVELLNAYVGESGKIEPSRITGTCAKHQRLVSREIKKAREMALIRYIVD